MSWGTYTYDKFSSCACGKGLVIQHCWQEDDDWNRSNSGYTGIDINCPDCASKYHIETITRHYNCLPWKGDGVSQTQYLVPNGLKIPSIISPQKILCRNIRRRNRSRIYQTRNSSGNHRYGRK